jgi:antitoxin component of MazEF toxin-antitoxin module
MNTIVIEHVSVSELPKAWLAQLNLPITNRVTVRIEEESLAANNTEQSSQTNPLFGLWRNRDEMKDVDAYVRAQRASRF